ncbi:MAG: alpha/beta fold hydrolase [Roseiflexaceae bacterium]
MTTVLLHAYPLNQHMWQPQRDSLATFGPVITLDYAGFGASHWDIAPRTPRRIDDVAQHILTELDQRGIDQFAVAGLSMGGYVALAMWRIAAARIRGIAICNSRARADDEATKAVRTRNAEIARTSGAVAIADIMMPRLLSAYAPASVVTQVRQMALQASPDALANAMEMIRDRPDASALLPTIQVPSLVIGATDDPIMPVTESQSVADALPNSQCVIVPQCGHISNLERPQVFNAALIRWLTRVSDYSA